MFRRLFDFWHGLNMSRPVKTAVITGIFTVFAAVITVFGMIITSYIKSSDNGTKPTSSQAIDNQSFVQNLQQQQAAVINNYGAVLEPKKNDVSNEHVTGLQNGSFEDDLNVWQPSEVRIASADTVAVVGSHREMFSIDAYGRTGKCLLILNEQPTTPGRSFWRRQRIYGLKPSSKYELSFYMRGFAKSPRSLWLVIGDDWFAENRHYRITASETTFGDWSKSLVTLTTGDWEEAYFWIITDDICNLRIDDIAFDLSDRTSGEDG